MKKKNKLIAFLLCFLFIALLTGDTTQAMKTIVAGNSSLLENIKKDSSTSDEEESDESDWDDWNEDNDESDENEDDDINDTNDTNDGNEENDANDIENSDEEYTDEEENVVYDVENLQAEQKGKSILLSWEEGEGAQSYIIERKSAGKDYKELAIISSNYLTYTDKSITYQRKYTYRIKSLSEDIASDGVTVSFTAKLPKPSLTVKRQGSSGKLSWKKIDGADGYVIYMAASKNGSYKQIKTISSGKTVSYTKSKLSSTKDYYFKMRAYVNLDGKKSYSSYSSISALKKTENNKIKSKFNQLKKRFPDGKYWNHKGVSIKGKDISTIVTNKPCNYHTFAWASSCNYYYCPDGTIGYQCHGFAWKMSDLIFGKNAPVKRFTDFNKAKIGDVVRIRGVHTIIILAKHKDYVLAGEANVGGTCMIRWGRTYTKAELYNSVYYSRY